MGDNKELHEVSGIWAHTLWSGLQCCCGCTLDWVNQVCVTHLIGLGFTLPSMLYVLEIVPFSLVLSTDPGHSSLYQPGSVEERMIIPLSYSQVLNFHGCDNSFLMYGILDSVYSGNPKSPLIIFQLELCDGKVFWQTEESLQSIQMMKALRSVERLFICVTKEAPLPQRNGLFWKILLLWLAEQIWYVISIPSSSLQSLDPWQAGVSNFCLSWIHSVSVFSMVQSRFWLNFYSVTFTLSKNSVYLFILGLQLDCTVLNSSILRFQGVEGSTE